MPRKISPDRTYGEKIIALFAKLLFSNEKHSLIELSRMLHCSKQTVMRMVDDITLGYSVHLDSTKEEGKRYYQIKKKSTRIPMTNISESELHVLQMCRAFTEHLLGRQFFDEAALALIKSQALLPDGKTVSSKHFASYIPGRIDYTPQHEIIRTLIKSMDEKKVCKVTYKAIMAKRAKTFYIKPLKIFSHKDTIYLHARIAKYPGKPYKEPSFDPLIAIQRIKNMEITDRSFEFPANYDFEKKFNENFGVIKEDAFDVAIEFSGFAANYVNERIWSPDQKITKKKGDKIKLAFTASSAPELISWILSFGAEAEVIKPDWLIEEVSGEIENMRQLYVRSDLNT